MSERNTVSSMGGRAMPRIANASGSRCDSARLYTAGRSLRRVRSPEAPKMTMMLGSGFDMPAELCAQRRQHPLRERVIAARTEAREERRGDRLRGHRFLDRGDDRPAALTRVGDTNGEPIEHGILRERDAGQVRQPRSV